MGWFQGNFGLLNKLKVKKEIYYSYMMVSIFLVSRVDSILTDGKAGYRVESVQDFLIKLDMKPYNGNKDSFTKSCHSLSKIMNRADNYWTQLQENKYL